MFLLRRITLFVACLMVLASLPTSIDAQFGLGKKKKIAELQQQQQEQEQQQQGGLNLDDDLELLAAVEIFASMSPEEVEETMKELTEMLGDDPEALAAIEEVMKELPNMKVSDIQSSLKEMVSEDEIEAATRDALKMLGQSDWETIWEKQGHILDAVVQSGQISVEDATLFESDEAAWEKELRFIWNELQEQATAVKDEL